MWEDLLKSTRVGEASRAWETGGHDIPVVPESNDMRPLTEATTRPLSRAFASDVSRPDALRESAGQLNDLCPRRPAGWQ
jgi:hypothetical protein